MQQTDVLSKIMSGHFDAMPTDRELASDINRVVPEALRKALDEAKAAFTTLQSERDSLSSDLNAANRRADHDEIKRLSARQSSISAEVRQAQRTMLDAALAVADAQLAPLLTAKEATDLAVAELKAGVVRLQIAERRQRIIATVIDAVRSTADDVKRKMEKM